MGRCAETAQIHVPPVIFRILAKLLNAGGQAVKAFLGKRAPVFGQG